MTDDIINIILHQSNCFDMLLDDCCCLLQTLEVKKNTYRTPPATRGSSSGSFIEMIVISTNAPTEGGRTNGWEAFCEALRMSPSSVRAIRNLFQTMSKIADDYDYCKYTKRPTPQNPVINIPEANRGQVVLARSPRKECESMLPEPDSD